ncbi:hypothetical protein EE612_050647 [Oryza sativa]|nr:hypothetical protein EE612_050647 [Oryza sativa]
MSRPSTFARSVRFVPLPLFRFRVQSIWFSGVACRGISPSSIAYRRNCWSRRPLRLAASNLVRLDLGFVPALPGFRFLLLL